MRLEARTRTNAVSNVDALFTSEVGAIGTITNGAALAMTAATTHSCETGGDADAPFSCIEGGESEARMAARCLDWSKGGYNKTKKYRCIGRNYNCADENSRQAVINAHLLLRWLALITLIMTSCNYAKSGTRLRLVRGYRCFVGLALCACLANANQGRGISSGEEGRKSNYYCFCSSRARGEEEE